MNTDITKTLIEDETEQALLTCPIRGNLNTHMMAKDGLKVSEEKRRIDLIKFLLKRNYPKSHFAVETVLVKKLGESGRNSLRCDLIIYDTPVSSLADLSLKEKLERAILVAEVKRDSTKKNNALSYQLEPAMRLLPNMNVMGAYWDDINKLLYVKRLVEKDSETHLDIIEDSLANLPKYGNRYKETPLTFDNLTTPENLKDILMDIANIMRSHGVNDEQTRYKETVKLLLARYCDEREAKASSTKELQLQVFKGTDINFMKRVNSYYEISSRRYSRAKTLFSPNYKPDLEERTLREIIKSIQDINFTATSNEAMQDVFMSFVPAVFKKSLDQYFTPIGLIQAIIKMVKIGPNDIIADPAMGTADFLTGAMEDRLAVGDDDIVHRVYGIDSDQKAYDLAVVNMILNKDGQSNLVLEDSIEQHERWNETINIALCNPPFGEKSIENRKSVLQHYDLGYKWIFNEDSGEWEKTEEILKSQQLGILFIERCFKLLANEGRVAIILPEGYLCTPSYGYVRQWILNKLRIISLTELPRRIFTKSNADLRSNILIAQKLSSDKLAKIIKSNYPIHSEIVRKVGFKMGKGFQIIPKRDPKTGIALRSSDNKIIPDSDFIRVQEGFEKFTHNKRWDKDNSTNCNLNNWEGAKINDVLNHPQLDLKPRRLMPKALSNINNIKKGNHCKLGEIADVLETTISVEEKYTPSDLVRLVEGLNIRAVDGFVVPDSPTYVWKTVKRKSKKAYQLQHKDIIVGLVRPERRNIGLLLEKGDNIIGSIDGIAVIRIKPELEDKYPQEWLFTVLRSEYSRLQLWTESGGTSYGKLNRDHLLNLLIELPKPIDIVNEVQDVKNWVEAMQNSITYWNKIGTDADRKPIINSSSFGLVELEDGQADDEDDDI
ncbi:N-6 DNA methylase (plasmid) [Bacillus bombysepticus]|nr:N-6 DNA methylase [Bacillus bombysepticus]